MKNTVRLFLLVCVALGSGLSASAQFLDHLRALSVARFPIGDPAVTVSNIYGLPQDGPKDIAVADLDGDGTADFAGSDKDGSITVYFGNGDGTFTAPLYLRTWTTAPADLRGFVATNYTTNCTQVYTNYWESNGVTQTNWAWVCLPGSTNIYESVYQLSDGPTGLRGLALADFTGDGLRDIAVASPGESIIYLLVNSGGRHFAPAVQIPAWFGVRDLAAGDFDGDGKWDLAAAGTTNGVAQYRSHGDGTFELVTNLFTVGTKKLDNDFPQPAFYLKAFRPSGATRDQLAVGRAGDHPVRILGANSAGELDVQMTLSNVVVHALDVGPLLHDRTDGTLDLVSVNHSDDVVEIRAGAGGGVFETNVSQSISIAGRAHGVAIADLDNDGWNDLIVVLQRFDKVSVLRNNHGTFSIVSEVPVGAGPRELGVGDFNGDGRSDAAILNRNSSDVSVLIAYPTLFGFSTLDMIYPADGEIVSLQVYDFNGDGRDDVVQIHRAAGQMSVRLAHADGGLSEPVFYGLGSQPSDMRTVDVNHDGILDILAVDLGGFVTVRLGVGDGTFGPEIRTSLQEYAQGGWSQGRLFSLAAADFDGDGNIDVAAGYMDCRVGLFKGNGDGTFVHTHTHLLGYETHGMAAGDFDGDGDIDLVAEPWDGSLVVVNNPGDLLSAYFLDKTVITNDSGNSGAWTILVTDYNHDGDLDLLVDGSGGYALWLGGPGVEFTFATNILRNVNPVPAVTPVTADFNNDGFQDIIAACVGKSCVSVSLGRADGTFDEPMLIAVPSSQLIATGDLDGDGLPDLVGTGDVLWTALSSRAPSLGAPPAAGVTRPTPAKPMINEVLAANSTISLIEDGGRTTDYVELFNGGGTPVPLLNWKLRLERTNSTGIWLTNDYRFPTNAIMDATGRLVIVCSDRIRTPYHTGFNLPAEGGSLCLIRDDNSEADRVSYPAQETDHAFARFQDGVNGFVVTDTPTPGQPNVDTGLMAPEMSIDGFDLTTLKPNQPIRFFAHAKDDVGIVNLSILWRRLDIPDDVTKRAILYDDGFHNDGGIQDGFFSGLLEPGLPAGAEIQFYLECTDLSGQVATAPGNPLFVTRGQTPDIYTLAVGQPRSPLEISEIVADNMNGLQDEQGKKPDWIEIRNCSTQAVSLVGVTLGQGFFGNGGVAFTNGLTLAPGQHFVVYADGKPELGQPHAPFKLNRDGDHVVLTGLTSAGARYVVDSLDFGYQQTDAALARLGYGGPWVRSIPTPRAQNVAGAWQTLVQSNTFLLAYPTRADSTYTVEYKDRLNNSGWTALPPVRSIGVEQTVQQPLGKSRFFRVREQ